MQIRMRDVGRTVIAGRNGDKADGILVGFTDTDGSGSRQGWGRQCLVYSPPTHEYKGELQTIDSNEINKLGRRVTVQKLAAM